MRVVVARAQLGAWLMLFLACTGDARPLFAWSQVIQGSNLSVRAVVFPDEQCPVLTIGPVSVVMSVRAAPVPGVFDDKVCEVVLPPSPKKRTIEVDGLVVPDLQKRSSLIPLPVKVAFIGDTGCRVSRTEQQNCKSEEWPFREVLLRIAEQSPDFIVHVGDYIYRESECMDDSKCDKGVHGDKSSTWYVDLLRPLQSISSKFPFVFVRGNHEDCNRSFAGWFRYIDARPAVAVGARCEDAISPWLIDLDSWAWGKDRFYVVDSSSTPDTDFVGTVLDLEDFGNKFTEGIGDAGVAPRLWLLTHKPLWAHGTDRGGGTYYGDVFQVSATGTQVMEKFTGVISGHVHAGQLLNVKRLSNHPASGLDHYISEVVGKERQVLQIVTGNGGSRLYKVGDAESFTAGGYSVSNIRSVSGFGFCVLDIPPDYGRVVSTITGSRFSIPTVTLRDLRGKVLVRRYVDSGL